MCSSSPNQIHDSKAFLSLFFPPVLLSDPAEEYILERAHKRLLKDSCTPAILLQAVRELLGNSPAPSNVPSAHPSPGAETAKARTVVYVEDNPVVLMAYRNRLERDGFHVEPVSDGLEAIKLLSRQQAPDMVILGSDAAQIQRCGGA